jgi:hypothetical protein
MATENALIATEVDVILHDYSIFSSKRSQLLRIINRVGFPKFFEACPKVTPMAVFFCLNHHDMGASTDSSMGDLIDYLALEMPKHKDTLHRMLCMLMWSNTLCPRKFFQKLLDAGACDPARRHEYVAAGSQASACQSKIDEYLSKITEA